MVTRRAAMIAVLCSLVFAAPAGAHVYWTEFPGTIGRANLDGTDADHAFVTIGAAAYALDVDGRHVYWSLFGPGAIGRANLDGSGANDDFIHPPDEPRGLAVDDRHVFWGFAPGPVGRANLDGSNVVGDVLGSGGASPYGVAVDERYVYWADQGTGAIGRANLDGSGADPGFISGAGSPVGVAVDGAHVYWSDSISNTIARANLDGTGIDASFIAGASTPFGVAVDANHVYWSNFAAGTIGRANLDGSGVDQAFITGADFTRDVAVDDGPAGTASASATALAFGSQPLGTLGPPQALTVTNTGHGVLEIDAARVTGGDADDFLVSHDTCSRSRLAIGDSCMLRVRFGPSAGGARHAVLRIAGAGAPAPLDVALRGVAGALPAGATGPAGADGPTGAPGARGPRGRPGRVRLVTCRRVRVSVRGRTVERRRCRTRVIRGTATFTTGARARVTVTRRGRRVASGTAIRTRLVLHARGRLRAGRYTLTLRARRGPAVRMRVTIR